MDIVEKASQEIHTFDRPSKTTSEQLIEEVCSLRAENEAHRWRHIDTAPQDGSLLLLGWWRTWPKVEWECAIDAAGTLDTGRPGTRWRHGQATHWMPLPEPPELRGEGEK